MAVEIEPLTYWVADCGACDESFFPPYPSPGPISETLDWAKNHVCKETS